MGLLDCLDLFGASQSVSKMWRKHGFESVSYDIKLNAAHDITSRSGFLELIKLGAECLDINSFIHSNIQYIVIILL